ncbi:hypothetical protein BU14_0382s0008 [Porphyra umbilicalis]|uniref:Uncharacterized protein n=1 Tax=Porphyra umbilicalis TaxID=2786 RepID=A0A1X6NX12_PORUM|nr:hypothetical protein BU14_0382s0008 [Porphyra umbilicalis]|eukprot:OSX73046.1 hypothetical protein BU14_0382s0008 [Porphyra umbilicalis]
MVAGPDAGSGGPPDVGGRRCPGCGGVFGGCACLVGGNGAFPVGGGWHSSLSAGSMRGVEEGGGDGAAGVASPRKRARRASVVPPPASSPADRRPPTVCRVLPPAAGATPPPVSSLGVASHTIRVVPPRPSSAARPLGTPSAAWGGNALASSGLGGVPGGGNGAEGTTASPWRQGPIRAAPTPATPSQGSGASPPRARLPPRVVAGVGATPPASTCFRAVGGSPHPSALPTASRPPIRPLVIRPATHAPSGTVPLRAPRTSTPASAATGPLRPRPLGIGMGAAVASRDSPSIARQLFGGASDVAAAVANSSLSCVSRGSTLSGGEADDTSTAHPPFRPRAVEEESPRVMMASPSQRRYGVIRGPAVGSSPRLPSIVGVSPGGGGVQAPGLTSPLGRPGGQAGLGALSMSICTSATPLPTPRTQPGAYDSPCGGRDVTPTCSGSAGGGVGCRAPPGGHSVRLQLLQRRARTSTQLLRHASRHLTSAVEVTAVEARGIAASSLALYLVGVDAAAQLVVAVLLEAPPVAEAASGAATDADATAASRIGSEVPGLAAGARVAVVCPQLLAAVQAENVEVTPGTCFRIRVPPPAGIVQPSALPNGGGVRLGVAGVVLGLDYVQMDVSDPLLSEDAVALSARLSRGDVDALFPSRTDRNCNQERTRATAVIHRFSWAENLFAPRVTLAAKVIELLTTRRALVEDDAGQLGVITLGDGPTGSRAFQLLRTGVTFLFDGLTCSGRSFAVASAVDALAGYGPLRPPTQVVFLFESHPDGLDVRHLP